MKALWVMGTAKRKTVHFPNLVNLGIFFVQRRIFNPLLESLPFVLPRNLCLRCDIFQLRLLPAARRICLLLAFREFKSLYTEFTALIMLSILRSLFFLTNPNLCFKNWRKLRCRCTAFLTENLAFKSIFHVEFCVDFVCLQFSQSV